MWEKWRGWMWKREKKKNSIRNDWGKEIKLQIFDTKIKFELRIGGRARKNRHEVFSSPFPWKVIIAVVFQPSVTSGVRRSSVRFKCWVRLTCHQDVCLKSNN
jgi:hypothetical protein